MNVVAFRRRLDRVVRISQERVPYAVRRAEMVARMQEIFTGLVRKMGSREAVLDDCERVKPGFRDAMLKHIEQGDIV